jgi:hypothetical protein
VAPRRIFVWEGRVIVVWAKALEKTRLREAKLSKWGVFRWVEPLKPTLSARSVSIVIRSRLRRDFWPAAELVEPRGYKPGWHRQTITSRVKTARNFPMLARG